MEPLDTKGGAVGTYPILGLADARGRAKDDQGEILQDHDPAAERQTRKNAAVFRELATEHLEKYAKKENRSWRRDEEIIDRKPTTAVTVHSDQDSQYTSQDWQSFLTSYGLEGSMSRWATATTTRSPRASSNYSNGNAFGGVV